MIDSSGNYAGLSNPETPTPAQFFRADATLHAISLGIKRHKSKTISLGSTARQFACNDTANASGHAEFSQEANSLSLAQQGHDSNPRTLLNDELLKIHFHMPGRHFCKIFGQT